MAARNRKARAVDTRRIGNIEVSAMGFGGWAIGGPFASPDGQPLGWGDVDDDESIAALRTAHEAGVTLFDTANVYGTGHSERVIARAFSGHRDEVVYASKWGNGMVDRSRIAHGLVTTPEGLKRQLAESLERLDTDYLDLFQFHINHYDGPEVDDLAAQLETLVDEGTIRTYGWSTDFPECAERWLGRPGYAAIQAQVNVFEDNAGIIALAEANGLAVLNRGPLAMGLLTGKYTADTKVDADSVRGTSPEWLAYFDDGVPSPRFLAMLEQVRDALTADGRSLVQGAIGWLWARSGATIPIPGIRTVARATENAGALAFGPLPDDQFAEVERLLRS